MPSVSTLAPWVHSSATDTQASPIYAPTFAPAWAVPYAAGSLRDAAGTTCTQNVGTTLEGPRPRVHVAPGAIRVSARDHARAERTQERARLARLHVVHESAAATLGAEISAASTRLETQGLEHVGQVPDVGLDPLDRHPSRSRIIQWSRKSRRNMTETLCTLDYAPLVDGGRVPLMLTLTYPGDWQTVAPVGSVVKEHMDKLRKRYFRRWGRKLVCVWKLEFQSRGAPHLHFLTSLHPSEFVPFRQWVSATWAAIVDHPDPEQRRRHVLAGTAVDRTTGYTMTDPKRVAVYFNKHGLLSGKEYQNVVPALWREPGAGPGRFWGVWGLTPAVVEVPVTFDQAQDLTRTLRRWHSAGSRAPHREDGSRVDVYRDGTPVVTQPLRRTLVERVDTRTGQVRKRRVRRRIDRMRTRGGFLSVNDGPALALRLAYTLEFVATGPVGKLP